jgi:hypothetical protein
MIICDPDANYFEHLVSQYFELFTKLMDIYQVKEEKNEV